MRNGANPNVSSTNPSACTDLGARAYQGAHCYAHRGSTHCNQRAEDDC